VDDPKGGDTGGKTVCRLREGVERYWVTDINDPSAAERAKSNIFVMHDLMFIDSESEDIYTNHEPAGMNVLYMDGHVEFLEHGTPEFSAKFSDAYLRALAGALTN